MSVLINCNALIYSILAYGLNPFHCCAVADDGKLLAKLPKVKVLRNNQREGKKGFFLAAIKYTCLIISCGTCLLLPCNGLASHPGGRSNTLSCFIETGLTTGSCEPLGL